MERLKKAAAFARSEAVLLIAAGAALVSAFLIPPDGSYLGYVDWRVLSLLFCLMAVVAGLTRTGLFRLLAQGLAGRAKSTRVLLLLLVLLCFFSSMLVTNDVALLTFVPFSILTLTLAEQQRLLIPAIALETAAANLGSMLTPVGNPQNLYLYAYYEMDIEGFFRITLPLTAFSMVLVALLCLLPRNHGLSLSFSQPAVIQDKRRLGLHLGLLALCLLTVFGLVPYPVTLGAVLLCLLLFDRPVFPAVNYSLLLTFVCFFVFVGNVGRMERVREVMASLLDGRELWCAVLLSQVISNVPAAVMLSTFTGEGAALVAGTNIGGLGTLVASLASLIAFRLYAKSPDARPGRYLLVFTGYNLLLLALLAGFVLLLPPAG